MNFDSGKVAASEQPCAAAAVILCDARALEEKGRAWVWDVLEYRHPARAFVLRFEGRLHAYINRCLHVPTEMDWRPGEFLDADRRYILCSTHGASYTPQEGRCVGGPCGRGRLTAVRVEERDGQVYWYPSRDIQPLAAALPAAESPP